MANQLNVAFVWHMHQPLYQDRASGRYLMPWVRLHATKDYLDMLQVLDAYPSHHQTFNLVPSLLAQIADYATGGATDRMLDLLVKPAGMMGPDDRQYLYERGFDAHGPTMIRPHPRYAALLDKRDSLKHLPARRAVTSFSDQDWVDLVVWFNLAWFDPTFQDADPVLQALLTKGQGFDDADRQALLGAIRETCARVIPAYKAAAAAGRVELTTTPYYHPILPLLCDLASARVARPDLPLPAEPFARPGDAAAQVRKGLDAFAGHFGGRPAGMWPSEQSVSPAALALLAEQGLQWTISDEGVLGHTIGRRFERDGYGVTPDAALLYQPWRVHTTSGPIAMVYRDVVLSDLIGFTYAQMPADAAAADLHGRLERIRRLLPDGEAYLVTIALDGENCWEQYQRDGGPFLHAFHQRMAANPALHMVTVAEHLAAHPPRRELTTIHAGSWIASDFTTWIGDATKNLAWDALARARTALDDARERLEGTPAWDEAVEEIMIAEGSDWFWWYGVGHDSGQDELFDAQFRLHLRRLYEALGEAVPADLEAPIAPAPPAVDPRAGGMLPPRLDGDLGDAAWASAAEYDPGAGQGAMQAAAKAIRRVRYGSDAQHLYVGLSYADQYRPQAGDELGLYFFHPGQPRLTSPLPFLAPLAADASSGEREGTAGYRFAHAVQLAPAANRAVVADAGEHDAWHVVGEPAAWVSGKGLEVALPLDWLDALPGAEVRFVVAVVREGRLIEVQPPHDGLPFSAPAAVAIGV